jgi:hypothetical protein
MAKIIIVKTKCPCGASIEQDGKRSMKKCVCGEKWNFTINIDGSVHLFHCRPRKDYDIKAKPMSISFAPYKYNRAKKAGYGLTELAEIGYQVAVLGTDISANRSKIV